MPWSTDAVPRTRRTAPIAPAPPTSSCRALMVINNRPLQRTAWAAFHTARKRLDKLSSDLRRHEETDTPAYSAWLHGTFPQRISALRELHAAVALKGHQVATVQFEAAMTGRSLKKIWKEFQDELANPRPPEPEPDDAPPRRAERDRDRRSGSGETDDEEPFDDFFKDLFGDDDPRDRPNDSPRSRSPAAPPPSADAREIYRRLVQHLHPDRGGEWTHAREKLWHEVQQAWAARDPDWLARLELTWETANDTLSPESSLDRLRRAIAELHAAHRDLDRKLRDYRQSFPWRFSLSPKKRDKLHLRVEASLRDELEDLQRQLDYLNSTIAAWESPLPSRTRSGNSGLRKR